MFLMFFLSIVFSYFLNAQERIEVFGQKEPLSLAAAPWEVDVSAGQNHGADLWQQMVNVGSVGGSNRPRFFQIRGIGESSAFEDLRQSPVGFFYDGIDLSEEASVFSFLQSTRAQVLYGPHGTLYGGKGLGGVVEAKSPLGSTGGSEKLVGLTVGRFDDRQFMVDLPFETPLGNQIHLGVLAHESSGAIENTHLKRKTAQRKELNLVFGGHYQLGSWFFLHSSFYGDHQNGYDHWSRNFDFKTRSDAPGRDFHQVHGHSFRLLKDSGLYVEALTSLTVSKNHEAFDEDWGNDPDWEGLPGWNRPYNYRSENLRERTKWHQQIFVGPSEDLRVGIHLYGFREDQTLSSYKNSLLRDQEAPQVEHLNMALVFLGQWESSFGGLWKSGGRLESLRRQRKLQGETRNERDLKWSGELGLSMPLWAGVKSHWKLSKAYRGGGYNTVLQQNLDMDSFGAEDLYSLQWTLGWGPVTHQLFYNYRENQQMKSSVQLSPEDPNSYTFFTDNAHSSQSWGMESFVASDLGAMVYVMFSLGL